MIEELAELNALAEDLEVEVGIDPTLAPRLKKIGAVLSSSARATEFLALRAGFCWPHQSTLTATKVLADMFISNAPFLVRWCNRINGKFYGDLHVVRFGKTPELTIFSREFMVKAITDFIKHDKAVSIHHYRSYMSGPALLKYLDQMGAYPDVRRYRQ